MSQTSSGSFWRLLVSSDVLLRSNNSASPRFIRLQKVMRGRSIDPNPCRTIIQVRTHLNTPVYVLSFINLGHNTSAHASKYNGICIEFHQFISTEQSARTCYKLSRIETVDTTTLGARRECDTRDTCAVHHRRWCRLSRWWEHIHLTELCI